MLLVIGGLVLVAAVIGAVVLLSGGDDERDPEDQAYVDELVANLETDPATEAFAAADMECLAGALVDTWGREALQAAGTPAEIAASDDMTQLGLPMNRDLATAYTDNIEGCMSLRGMLVEAAQNDPDTPAQQRVQVACLFENAPEDVVREMFISELLGEENMEAENALAEVARNCQ